MKPIFVRLGWFLLILVTIFLGLFLLTLGYGTGGAGARTPWNKGAK